MRIDVLGLHQLANRLRPFGAHAVGAVRALSGALFSSSIEPDAEIGEETALSGRGRGIFIHGDAVVGRRCRVGDGVTIGAHGEVAAPVIGDDVVIRRGAKILGGARVGSGAVIGANAVVDFDVAEGERVPDAPSPAAAEGRRWPSPPAEVPPAPAELRRRREVRRLGIVQFTRGLYVGGTEGQFIELLRALAPVHDVWVGVLDANGPYLSRVRELGFEPREFPIRGGVLRPNTAAQIRALARWLSRTGAEVVHVHDFAGTLLAVPAAKLAGCRVVVSRLDLAHYHTPLQRAVLGRLTRRADRVVANAEAIRRMLIREEGVAPERIAVIHNGIDLRRFDRRRAAPLQAPLPDVGGRPVILHVANMSHPVKRQEDVLAALVELRARGVDADVFFAGDGPRRPELERLAVELGVGDRAHFLGLRQDVPALCACAAVGVLCSTAEGLSNAVIEGMAASLPMVVTPVGGNADLVAHRARGLVVPPREPRALASAVAWMLEHPQAAARMGEAARAFVERELSLPAMVAAHEEVYLAAINPWPRGPRSRPLPRDPASASP